MTRLKGAFLNTSGCIMYHFVSQWSVPANNGRARDMEKQTVVNPLSPLRNDIQTVIYTTKKDNSNISSVQRPWTFCAV